MDAVVIACCTDAMIQKITRYTQGRELRFARGLEYVDEETGEIFSPENMSHNEWDEIFGVMIPLPWNTFRTELEVRFGDNPKEFLDTHLDVNSQIDYPIEIYNEIRPIFVSRMPNHKIGGAAHKETIRSPRHFEDEGIVITKTALKNLKLKDGEIEGYYNKESDILLYNALKSRLEAYNNEAKEAFAEDFHKPKSDGTPGPIVRKVKTISKQTSGVFVNEGKGIAENGEMIRIDVFRENGKYYFVPIYTADVVKKVIPNGISTVGRPRNKWREIDDKYFLFSLYSRDLIHIKSKNDIKLKYSDGRQETQKELFSYFIGADISTVSISGMSHDRSFSFRGLGIQKLDLLEKCYVDMLGNISIVKHEQRMKLK
jgi:CRISPR-associated endonuclease Csn1